MKIFKCIKPYLPKSLRENKCFCCKQIIVNQYKTRQYEDFELRKYRLLREPTPLRNIEYTNTSENGSATPPYNLRKKKSHSSI